MQEQLSMGLLIVSEAEGKSKPSRIARGVLID
jgi:hypothetical protein